MQLFSNKGKRLTSVATKSFKLEKEIQILVERNLETLFELEFVSTEFIVDNFRLDTLAYDEHNNSFVIIEYKNKDNLSVVDQGYAYLSAMKDNKSDFILEYNERNTDKPERHLKKSDITWENTRILFISPSFNKFQKSINFKNFQKDLPFELWVIKKFDKDLITLERSQSNSIKSITNKTKRNLPLTVPKISSSLKILTEKDHTQKLEKNMLGVWTSLKEKLEVYPEISFSVTKLRITWKRNSTIVCSIFFSKKCLRIEIVRGNKSKEGKASRNFFTIKDPMKISKEVISKVRPDNTRHYYFISLKDQQDIEYFVSLLEQKYKSLE